ncbi:MAG TPA: type III pantothenate kinase [Pirellulales bacterium]|jgi:type III pantothenate kinase
MNAPGILPLVAVDVGNSRVKLGLFDSVDRNPLPEPVSTLDIGPSLDELEKIRQWLPDHDLTRPAWWIGSVQRDVAGRLVAWLKNQDVPRITMIASSDLPLVVSLPQPDRVGIDRLLDAVAANRLRRPGEAAVVVDLGTAITVDLIDGTGAFLGGAIMPGIATSARAMHEFTDLLPLVEMWKLGEAPAPLGTATIAAMQAGLFWGAVGGVRELVEQLGAQLKVRPRLFLSGGAAPSVAKLLAHDAEYVSHLTLAGIAITAAQ